MEEAIDIHLGMSPSRPHERATGSGQVTIHRRYMRVRLNLSALVMSAAAPTSASHCMTDR